MVNGAVLYFLGVCSLPPRLESHCSQVGQIVAWPMRGCGMQNPYGEDNQ